MAYENDIATDYLDLLERVRDFLVTNTDLVTDGQEWEVIAGVDTGTPVAGDYISFKGQGLGGTDDILLTLSAFEVPANNAYNLLLKGHTGYNLTDPGPTQPNSSGTVVMPLGNTAIEYWIHANGRHFTLVTKFNTRYDWMHAGFILPDHLPEDWSYPMFVGGSAYTQTLAASSDVVQHSAFYSSASDSTGVDAQCSAYLFAPSNTWRPVRNGYTNSGSDTPTDTNGGICITPWDHHSQTNCRRNLDGTPWIARGNLFAFGNTTDGGVTANSPDGGAFYGSFDDVFYTPSFGATAEQTFSVAGRDYIMFPNVARTSDKMFAAIPQD